MNLQLCAIKKGKQPTQIQLVVIDLDKSKNYPLNYVCILPRYFRLLEKRTSKFAKIFGSNSLCLAKKLLTEAKRKESDPDIQAVINRRIKDINLKQNCTKVET